MRRISLTALLAAPFLLFAGPERAKANPPGTANFGCAGFCFKLFPHIHQHGPLFNYGPYYGYYPFAPYGPWDAYLRYDPFFYGDPSARGGGSGLGYGHSLGLHLPSVRGLFSKHGCSSCGFHHASWLHGGWFRGHKWLDGGHGAHKTGCQSCGGGVSVPAQPVESSDPVTKYRGIGTPTQSSVFYGVTPTLNPMLDLPATAGHAK